MRAQQGHRLVGPSVDVADEHQALAQAAIDGRADEAVALLGAHFERTAGIIRDDPGLFADEPAPSAPTATPAAAQITAAETRRP